MKRGRPFKAEEDRLTEQVNVRMSKEERIRLDREAERLGISLSALLMRPWRKSTNKKGE